jgi:2-keto-4-pentenoate hydratase/2-oxohepta-3-ene-1,7-dioic acid hydratase in catechol pathway
MAIPTEPILFNKLANCIVGPTDDVMIPKNSTKLDWEIEIAFVIGKRARYVEEKDAASHIAGYCLANDVSERVFQIERLGQWVKGKAFETSCPLGPWLVTSDEVKDPQALDMWLDVNGKRMQTGNTKNMIFGCAYLLHYMSQFFVMEPGDVVVTGTPPGVGLGIKPTPVFLKEGDTMTLGIQGLGEQRTKVVPFRL